MLDLTPWGELSASDISEAKICVMGVPFDGGVSCGKGAAEAPARIRSLSRYLPPYTEEMLRIDGRLYDAGDIPLDLNWERYYGNVEERAFELLSSGRFCLFLGGDHSVTIPLQRAWLRAARARGEKTGVIHFESHADMCEEYDGSKWSHACTERRAIDEGLSPDDIAFVGLRSYEADEVNWFLEHPNVMIKRARDIFREGCVAAAEQLVGKFADYGSVYLSLDIDVLDPAFAPGTGTPEAGGLSSRELMEMLKLLLPGIPIKAMDIVEVSPPLDTANGITAWAALKLIYEALYYSK
ncbi:MAG: agmatinase [Clostridiales Family XIII bacterium]|nr:agmatinase [Clostridiales Family XIII bacterium]